MYPNLVFFCHDVSRRRQIFASLRSTNMKTLSENRNHRATTKGSVFSLKAAPCRPRDPDRARSPLCAETGGWSVLMLGSRVHQSWPKITSFCMLISSAHRTPTPHNTILQAIGDQITCSTPPIAVPAQRRPGTCDAGIPGKSAEPGKAKLNLMITITRRVQIPYGITLQAKGSQITR